MVLHFWIVTTLTKFKNQNVSRKYSVKTRSPSLYPSNSVSLAQRKQCYEYHISFHKHFSKCPNVYVYTHSLSPPFLDKWSKTINMSCAACVKLTIHLETYSTSLQKDLPDSFLIDSARGKLTSFCCCTCVQSFAVSDTTVIYNLVFSSFCIFTICRISNVLEE